VVHTDADLIEAAKNGQQQAFSELVRRYEGPVGATVVGMLGNTAEADDVAQEVFVRFYRSLDKFRGQSTLKTYLTRIAINQSLTALNRQKRAKWFSLHGKREGELPLYIPETGTNPEQRATQQAVQMALRALPPDARAVIVLRMLEGYSTQETADMLGIPMGTVLSRLARAQKKFKSLLPQFGIDIRT